MPNPVASLYRVGRAGAGVDGKAMQRGQNIMDIVDSQVHIWGADTPERPWPAGRAQDAQKPYPISKEALLFQMDLAGVGTWHLRLARLALVT